MLRIISVIGAVSIGTLFVAACSDDADIRDLRSLRGTDDGAGSAGRGGSAGGAGRGGSAGSAASSAAGRGGSPGAAGRTSAGSAGSAGSRPGQPDVDAGPIVVDAGDAGVIVICDNDADCDDNSVCTTDACVADRCQFTPLATGTACGDSTVGECTAADTCSAAGVCLTNNQPDGTVCADGFCNLTGACDCAIERVTVVPYTEQWITIGTSVGGSDTSVFDASCQLCANDLDHIVVFQAPVDGSYVFAASSAGNAQVWVVESDCTDLGTELACDDGDGASDGFDAQVEVTLEQGQTVTVGVSEVCEGEGGSGDISITLADD